MRAPVLEIFSDLSAVPEHHCLAAGHYQPLADSDALHIARTKGSSAVGVRRHSKIPTRLGFSGALRVSGKAGNEPAFECALKAAKAGGPFQAPPALQGV
jgi:hypothetical protein